MITQKERYLLLKSLAEFKFFLPPDVFERHKFISSFIWRDADVLDVGGSLSRLNDFIKTKKIIIADIKYPADIIFDGKKLPIADSVFDIVTSIDVLEHIKKPDREAFLTELVRVAKHRIIISAPYGSKEHLNYEKKILSFYKNKKKKFSYLKEHIKNGLPSLTELDIFIKKYNPQIYYSGNIKFSHFLFKIHNYEVKNTVFNAIIFFMKLLFNLLVNIIGYHFIINRKKSNNINRFYLVVDK